MDRRAAALRYDTRLPAPFVVASGRNAMADRLLRIAREAGVPVVDAPQLADRLVELDPGTAIPEELFLPVAQVLAFVLGVDQHVRNSGKNEDDFGQ